MFGAILVTNLLFVLVFQNSDFAGMLPLYTLIFISFISYAISKYRLLNFSMLIARSAAFSILILFSLGAYSLLLFTIARVFHGEAVSRDVWITSLLLAMFLAFSFESLRRWLGKATDFWFYKDKYDSNELLYHVSTVMASTLHLSELTKKILVYLTEEMRLTGGAFVLLHKNKIVHVATEGSFKDEVFDDAHIAPLLKCNSVSLTDESLPDSTKDLLRALGTNVSVKLQTDKSSIGLLLLGEKLSGEVFTTLDTQVISILAPQAAIAFENARAYEEIKRFNTTLKEEIHKATQDLKIANNELKELDQLKDEFVSIASHELRTPMTAIKDYLWMALAGKGGELTEKQRYYLTRSFGATERLIKLVNDLLNISRIESGRVSLEVAKVDLNQLITEVIEEVQARATQLKVKLVYTPLADPVFVVADPDKIKEVLINLIGNSLKFTDPGGTIWVLRKTVGEMIMVSVVDTGVGISDQNLTTLFQKFGLIKGSYRTNQAAGQGTGLGLYISRSIIELHQGKIWAESEGTGKGSTFAFTLPKYTSEKLSTLEQKFSDKSDAGIIRSVV
jgi:signal transduction histidine kinase